MTNALREALHQKPIGTARPIWRRKVKPVFRPVSRVRLSLRRPQSRFEFGHAAQGCLGPLRLPVGPLRLPVGPLRLPVGSGLVLVRRRQVFGARRIEETQGVLGQVQLQPQPGGSKRSVSDGLNPRQRASQALNRSFTSSA